MNSGARTAAAVFLFALVALVALVGHFRYGDSRVPTLGPDRRTIEREAVEAVSGFYRDSIVELERQIAEDSETIAGLRAELTEATATIESMSARQMSSRGAKRTISAEIIDVHSAIEAECAKQGINPEPVKIIMDRESGDDPWAVNPTSGAAGLFQRCPGDYVPLGKVAWQVQNGVAYIIDRYGTAENALAWWDRNGSY
ncbi:MAG: hypothetical protein M1548_05770 [Actinobacteria bacterium]|nr:hypothetical protein [Actinomycetota bacterium]